MMMRVLMLSTDENILREGTEARRRMGEYAALFEELHIVVLSRNNPHLSPPPLREGGKSLFIYLTNSWNKIGALFEAYKISERLLRQEARNDEKRSWVISAQDPFELGFIGYLLKRKFEVPLQLQVHTDFLSPYFWHESLKNKIRVLIAKWLLPRADGIRVVSERIKKSINNNVRLPRADQGIGPRNDGVAVLPIYVDVEKIKNAPIKADLHKKYPQFDFIILMASRLSREKNIGMAVNVMDEVLKRHPKAGLIIVGDGPEKEKLKLVIARSESSSDLPAGRQARQSHNIILESWTDDLASYYKTADLFLLTSFYEGYGRTIIEAMAAGLPIVMTDVGVAGDLMKDGENGYVIDSGDKRGLVERIAKLIEHPDLRKEISIRNLNAAKTPPTKEEYLKQYKALMSM